MKRRTRALGLLLLSIILSTNSLAQKASYTTGGGWTLGLGAGTTYQKSDLLNSRGFGADFVIGSQLYRKEHAFLSLDWKFRFLTGVNKAFDHRINPDDTYSNIRYNFYTYDLELGLTLNRLRERTGIVLTGFAGAGLTQGRTFTDLYDAGNNSYDYSGIDPNRDSKLVYDDLVALSDGDFETRLVKKAAFLPTAGLFIGYQISGAITLGIEYKTNFYLTEENGPLGIDLDNRILEGSAMDRNNYVSLGLGWTFRGGSAFRGSTGNRSADVINSGNTIRGTHQNVVAVSLPRPSVRIMDPSSDPHHTTSPSHTVRATVEHVNGADDISFFQNGYPNYNFTYNPNTQSLIGSIRLRDGENRIRIKAENQTATAEDQATIILDPPLEEVRPEPTLTVSPTQVERTEHLIIPEETALPEVWFTNPHAPVEVNETFFTVRANTQNVLRKNNVMVRFNGTPVSNFSFGSDGEVALSLYLSEGRNSVEIVAENEAGSARDQTFITYMKPVYVEPVYIEPVLVEPVEREPVNREPVVRNSPPVISVISPRSHPFRTGEQTAELRATVLNIDSKENITLNVNGSNTRNFSFNSSTQLLIARVALKEGRNVLTIHAQNRSGSDEKEQVFIKENLPCAVPVIRMIDPARNPSGTNRQSYTVRAEVRNIANRNQLRMLVNGNPVSFTFENQIVSSSVSLVSGQNTVTLNAENECGEDRASFTISYTPEVVTVPCIPPTVTFTVREANRNDASHELQGSVLGVEKKAGISITLDGRTYNGFQFTPRGRTNVGFQAAQASGDLSATFNLSPGSHTLVVTVQNECGTDTESTTVSVARDTDEQADEEADEQTDEEACGIRINPGNSDWQFCLVTPSGTFSRDNLGNSNFSYSGPATSLFFQPTGGGGNATVNGRPYPVKSGQYYLFSGSLNVTVSTGNPGSMGHWSVCIRASRPPVSGNGNNRPKSPCEAEKSNGTGGNGNNRSRR